MFKEFNCIFELKEECKKLVYVLYRLYKFFFDEEFCLKLDWGNFVGGENFGIGDDIERLYRIYIIFWEILDFIKILVKGYIRFLDIMYKIFIRLDYDVDLKEDCKVVV